MEVGLYIRDYMEDPDRPMYQQVEEAAEVCRRPVRWGSRSYVNGAEMLGHRGGVIVYHLPYDRRQ